MAEQQIQAQPPQGVPITPEMVLNNLVAMAEHDEHLALQIQNASLRAALAVVRQQTVPEDGIPDAE